MIAIRKLTESDVDDVKNLAVNSEQVRLVGTIEDLLSEVEDSWNYHVITENEKIVGFFNIDSAYSDTYPFTIQGELGLRAFFIDSSCQGKGYGKAATVALGRYLKEAYPDRSSIVLTVNCENPGAYRCYLGGGFCDTGELFHGGKAGPQHIMRMSLDIASARP